MHHIPDPNLVKECPLKIGLDEIVSVLVPSNLRYVDGAAVAFPGFASSEVQIAKREMRCREPALKRRQHVRKGRLLHADFSRQQKEDIPPP